MDRLRKVKTREVGTDQELCNLLKAFLSRGLSEKIRSVSRPAKERFEGETSLRRGEQIFFQSGIMDISLTLFAL